LAREQVARRDEVAEREKAETELAAKLVLLARIEWEAAHITDAARHLAECPERHRGPEWRYLDRMCRAEVASFEHLVKGWARVAYSPDGRLVAAVAGQRLTVWDVASRARMFDVGVEWSTDSKLAFTADGRRLVLIDVPGKAPDPNVRPADEAVPGMKAIRAQSNAKGTLTWQITIWDTATGVVTGSSRFAGPPRGWLARCPGVPLLAVLEGDRIRVWGPDARTVAGFAHGHRDARSLQFNATGRHLLSTGVDDPVLKVWEAATGGLVAVLKRDGVPHPFIEPDPEMLSPDGRWLLRSAPASEGTLAQIVVWDVERDREVSTIRTPLSSFSNTRFSPDGQSVATAHQNVVRVWDVATGRPTHVLRGHTGLVRGLAFGPDGRRLVSIAQDNTVRVWHLSASAE
jgi:WD40 repeat protein